MADGDGPPFNYNSNIYTAIFLNPAQGHRVHRQTQWPCAGKKDEISERKRAQEKGSVGNQ